MKSCYNCIFCIYEKEAGTTYCLENNRLICDDYTGEEDAEACLKCRIKGEDE
jgi:hypothetical protein